MSRKVVGVDEHVPVRLSLRQRQLILDHTFADPGLTKRLEVLEVRNRSVTAGYTLSEIDELAGFVAAEANHCLDRKLEAELMKLFVALASYEDRYRDDLSR